jgi:hypothetical protein
LKSSLGNDKQQLTDSIVSSWNTTLNNVSPSKLDAKESQFTAESKAGAALVILAILLDLVVPFIALILSSSPKLWMYSLSFASGLIAIGAGTLAALSVNDGVYGIIESDERGCFVIYILFGGVIMRLLSTISCFYGGSKPETEPNSEIPETEPNRGIPETGPNRDIWEMGRIRPRRTDHQAEQSRKIKIGYLGERFVFASSLHIPLFVFGSQC